MLREKWEWDTVLRKMVKVMAIQNEEDPITIYVQVDENEQNTLDGIIVDELNEELMSKINYEVKCPQCKTTTKIIGKVKVNDIETMNEPSFRCPDCHIEIPLLIRKGAL